MNADLQKLDVILEIFMGALLANKMDDRQLYAELLRRVRNLIRIEARWRKRRDEDAVLMQAWNRSGNVQN